MVRPSRCAADSDRIPCGDRNSASSSSRSSNRVIRVGSTTAKVSASPSGRMARRQRRDLVGAVPFQPRGATRRSRSAPRRTHGGQFATASSGSSPTSERTPHRLGLAVRRRPGRRRRTRPRRPTARRPADPKRLASPGDRRGSARGTSWRGRRTRGSCRASSSAIRIIAGTGTPSTLWRRTARAASPCGTDLRPVEDPDVVHAEEAALEQVGPVGVLAVHPPGEVEQQLGEDPDEEVVVPARRRCR